MSHMLPDRSGIPAIPGSCKKGTGTKKNTSAMPSRASQSIRCIPLDEWHKCRNRQHHIQVISLQTCSHVCAVLSKKVGKKGPVNDIRIRFYKTASCARTKQPREVHSLTSVEVLELQQY